MVSRGQKSKADLLSKLEEQIGAELPADYRAFLLDFDGKPPAHRHFEVVGPKDRYWNCLNALWPLLGQYPSVSDGWGLLQGNESHLLVIGEDGSGNWICVSTRGPQRGSYFVDAEYGPGEKQRRVRLAETFSEFLDGLAERKA